MIAKLAKNSSYVSEQKKMGVGKNKDPDDEEMEWIETFLNRFLLKINNKNTRTRCEIRSELTIGVVVVSLLLTVSIIKEWHERCTIKLLLY